MKETTIVAKENVELENPVLIEGLPGLGMVGKIAVEHLMRQTKAKNLAELYSPHFAYYVLVTEDGSVRLLRSEFYYWRNENSGSDIIFLTGDSQAQTIEGQYEVADAILEFAKNHGVRTIITIGGYREEAKEEPKVYTSATNEATLKKALEAGAQNSPAGNPVVGTAGLLLGMAKLKDLDAVCLLVETPGYLPDPKAAKSVLNVLGKMLSLKVDLKGLDKEILKSKRIEEKIKVIEEQRRISEKRRHKIEEEKTSYIS